MAVSRGVKGPAVLVVGGLNSGGGPPGVAFRAACSSPVRTSCTPLILLLTALHILRPQNSPQRASSSPQLPPAAPLTLLTTVLPIHCTNIVVIDGLKISWQVRVHHPRTLTASSLPDAHRPPPPRLRITLVQLGLSHYSNRSAQSVLS